MTQRKTANWPSLGAALLAGTALSQPAPAAETDEQSPYPTAGYEQDIDLIQLAQGESGEAGEGSEAGEGEGGEGEGGEGEGGEAASADLATDDVAYLSQLGLVRGHLLVGVELYKEGAAEMAVTHMKHPGDELYADLEPALAARGSEGFAEELERLATLVENGAPVAEVVEAHEALEAAIASAESAAGEISLPERLAVAVELVKVAAEEYGIGVKDGKLANAHEYQDAYGFVQIAGRELEQASGSGGAEAKEVIAEMRKQLATLTPAWPSLVPPDSLETDASLLYGAAARMELAANRLN